MILRTIKCDVCGTEFTEPKDNDGFAGWGAIMGIALNGVANPNLCPEHLAAVADFVDSLGKK